MHTYIRFAVGNESQDPRNMHGPFTEAERLRVAGELEAYEASQVSQIFDRFNDELPCPPWSSKKWSEDAASWFKDDAQRFISLMYDIIAILKEHGVQIRILKAPNLSKILYEDEFQVVAVDKRY